MSAPELQLGIVESLVVSLHSNSPFGGFNVAVGHAGDDPMPSFASDPPSRSSDWLELDVKVAIAECLKVLWQVKDTARSCVTEGLERGTGLTGTCR